MKPAAKRPRKEKTEGTDEALTQRQSQEATQEEGKTQEEDKTQEEEKTQEEYKTQEGEKVQEEDRIQEEEKTQEDQKTQEEEVGGGEIVILREHRNYFLNFIAVWSSFPRWLKKLLWMLSRVV